jgi:hypothetical protein
MSEPMHDTPVFEQQPAPPDPASGVGVTADQMPQEPVDPLDAALAEFEASRPLGEPEKSGASFANDPAGLEKAIAELLGPPAPDPKVQALEGELGALRAEQYRQQELTAFNKFSDAITKQIPPGSVPDDFVETHLKAAAHDPEIQLAWQYRNEDRTKVGIELSRVEDTLTRIQRGQVTATPQQTQALQQYGIALNSAAILSRVERSVLKSARGFPKAIDETATADRNMVAAAIRDGRQPTGYKPPPPELGKMSSQEYRKYLMDEYGIAGY